MSTVVVSDKKQQFLQSLEENFGGADLFGAVENLEIPTRRTEKWKYTRVNSIVNQEWKSGVSDVKDITSYNPFPSLEAVEIYMVNGLVAHISEDVPDGLSIESEHSESGMLSSKNIFSALNYSLCNVCLTLTAEKNQIVSRPVHIIHVSSGENVASFSRIAVKAEQSSFLQVIESFVSADDHKKWVNHVNEANVQSNAKLSITKWQELGENGHLMLHEDAQQASDSTFTSTTLTENGAFTRNDGQIALNGKNCETNLYGAYQPHGKEHIDNHTTVDHKEPHCNSNELYKGVIYDAATGVFNGKVFVREDAQLTNAFQQNSNIILTENGTMNSKPELEIYADDVKCSHGSTTGQFDDDALFYLKARGISDENARKLLVQAFLQEVIENIEFVEIQERMIAQ